MDVSNYLSEASFWTPDHSLAAHANLFWYPLASWVMEASRPNCIVQLGAREPGIYFAFCDAVARLALDARCLAVDSVRSAQAVDSSILDAARRRVREIHDRKYSHISKILRVAGESSTDAFPDRSIDLLHPSAPHDIDRFQDDWKHWLPKLSESAVLLLPMTSIEGRGLGFAALFHELANLYPTFEFPEGDGFGLVAIGATPPDRLRPLFEADSDPRACDLIRSTYSRLGQSLSDRLTPGSPGQMDEEQSILDLGVIDSASSKVEIEEATGVEEALALREELCLLREEFATLDERYQAIAKEHEELGKENPHLRQHLAHYQHHHAAALNQLEEIRRSTALRVIERCRGVRSRLFPQSRIHGRCFELSLRFLRVAASEGPRPAVARVSRRVFSKVRKTFGKPVEGNVSHGDAHTSEPFVFNSGFEELPWTNEVGDRGAQARVHARYKVLLVSHSACRTGAPLCLLRLAQELSRRPDIECWVVLRTGGELESEFAATAPTLQLARVVEAGLADWSNAPGLIAERFRQYARLGTAVCNTMAVSEFHAAFLAHDVPVLSWIHELPTFIKILGGGEAINRIKAASRRTIVPADVVRSALIDRFDVDPGRIQTIHYGLEARTRGLSRADAREHVLEELQLPKDAKIVLGCGTIDHRKGVDLFVQAARQVLAAPEHSEVVDRTYFLWFGFVVDEGLHQWLRHDVETAGFADRIQFAGVRDDLTPYFLAADLFALTSREDPCPFANLEAMESALPVVTFQDSGGAPEVLNGGGEAVPYLDVAAMARTMLRLLADPAERSAMGRRGRDTIRGSFTWPRFMDEFLTILRDDYDYTPTEELKVSVVVPNYRHAPYLEERLQSIFDQTVRPHEIIFLDDCSPDDSVEVARRLASRSPVPMRIVLNEENSGSTFRQWLKGMDLATGDLIWFAESDDSCHPQFLERLIPQFHDPDVALAYCQSALIGPKGERWAPDFHGHTDDVDPLRWRSAYAADAAEEAERALSQKNTVPNASAALFRKPERLDFAEELTSMRFAGDWFFYAMLIRDRKIAFVPESLNSYRRHEQTVSFQSIKADTHAEETLHVKFRVFETFDVSVSAMTRSLGQTALEYDMLTERFNLKRPRLSANVRAAGPIGRIRELIRSKVGGAGELKILLMIDGSETGLVATSIVHLANELASEHMVFLSAAVPNGAASELTDRLSERVILLEGTLGQTPWSTTDGADGRLRRVVLQELIRLHEIEVIHSLHETADRLVANINQDLNLPWFIHATDSVDSIRDREPHAINRVSGVFHMGTSTSAGRETHPELASKRWVMLYPGFEPEDCETDETLSGKRDEDFLVYLLAEGDRASQLTKDARTAVRVLNRLSSSERGGRRVRLVAPDLESGGTHRGDEILAALRQCDALLAPSQDVTTEGAAVLIAALACDLPAIAPDQGDVNALLTLDHRTAGLVSPPNDQGSLDVDRMVASMLRYLRNPTIHAEHVARAGELFDRRFHIVHTASVCTEAYLHARDFLVFPREVRKQVDRSIQAARESA